MLWRVSICVLAGFLVFLAGFLRFCQVSCRFLVENLNSRNEKGPFLEFGQTVTFYFFAWLKSGFRTWVVIAIVKKFQTKLESSPLPII